MSLQVESVLGTSVLSTQEVCEHLRVEYTEDASIDPVLLSLVPAATQFIATATGTTISTTSYLYTLDTFPDGRQITLPAPPLVSVSFVRYVGADGSTLTLSPTAYSVDSVSAPGKINLMPGESWPITNQSPGCIAISFTASSCGSARQYLIKQAILMTIGSWYECREGVTDRRYDEIPIPFAVSSLINLLSYPEAA